MPCPTLLMKLLALAAAFVGFYEVPLAVAADKLTATQLAEMAKSSSPGLRDAIISAFNAKDLKEGTAWTGRGHDFFFALETTGQAPPQLLIDGNPGPRMQQLAGSDLWYTDSVS